MHKGGNNLVQTRSLPAIAALAPTLACTPLSMSNPQLTQQHLPPRVAVFLASHAMLPSSSCRSRTLTLAASLANLAKSQHLAASAGKEE